MLMKYSSSLVILFISVTATSNAFLLPLLFPVSIKITIQSHKHHPPPPRPKPNYHFNPVPVYKEIVVKGNPHIDHTDKFKHSYGDGLKYGTSYGDGHVKVYTEEHRVKNHKYANGYGSGGHYPAQEYSEVPVEHHKGTPYTDHKDQLYIPEHQTHYKGTEYQEVPQTHYKGTEYQEVPQTHYKGTEYQSALENHYKGNQHQDTTDHYKVSDIRFPDEYYEADKKKVYDNNHSYIKSVGGYKLADYVTGKPQLYEHDKGTKYTSHVAVPAKVAPGYTYADIEAAHKATHAPKAYDSKEYADLGMHQYPEHQQQYAADDEYLDDSLPAYKYKPVRILDRKGQEAPRTVEPTVYAGYGTSIYGDSYAKMVYDPRKWKVNRKIRRS